MNKLYDRIDWENNTTPAINETNLNRMSKSLDDLDDRVIDIASTVMETVPEVQEDLAEARALEARLEELTENPPYIGANGNWYVWDTDTGHYVDSGVDASITVSVDPETVTLPAGSDAYVHNVGTSTDPILRFGIPKGPKGDTGGSTPGSDISDTVVDTITASSADYPEPAASETMKVIIGKIKKFLADLKGNKFDSTNVATIETSTTASQAYAAGEHLILEGQLYKVTSPITVGGTIVTSGTGQNVEADKVEDMGVTGVKGNEEVSYRTGNVNMTPANVGAVATSSIKNTYQSSPTAGAEVYDAAYINELAGVESVKVIVSNSSTAGQVQTAWSSSPVSIAGDSSNTYYKKTITLTHSIYGIPEVKPKASGNNKVMTDTEKGNYDCLDWYGLDPDYPTQLNLYAKTKPTGEFYIWVIRDGGRV